MRSVFHSQLNLGEEDIAKIKLDPKSRDDIPQLLAGLQYIYTHAEVRQAVFNILAEVVPCRAGSENSGKASTDRGRPGMEQWRILVLGTLRLGLDADYDRIHELANQHCTVRQMLGHGFADYKDQYHLQTIKDNLSLFTPELLDRINQEVIRSGHILLKKNDANLSGRCDSFVVKTDVHFPTDISLLFDAIRKTIEESAQLSETHDLTGWRQGQHNIKTFKKQYRIIQKQKHSTSKDETKKLAYEEIVKKSHESYINQAEAFLKRAAVTRQAVLTQSTELVVSVKNLDGYIAHAERQIDQIRRRVINGIVIPHSEKVFSIFQPHTEWISKGKSGVPVELGLRVCVLEDRDGFILHHRVMENETDDKIAVTMIAQAKERFPRLTLCSFDKGFHSPQNQIELKKELTAVVLPKKGRLSVTDKERESAPEFTEARQQHSGVESAINALGVHGLDMCPDHGINGFKRYVALAVVARNIQRLGAIVRSLAANKRGPYKKLDPYKLAA
ncbi:MAG: ISNCY family transposase [Desulfuromonadaceae bacterium]